MIFGTLTMPITDQLVPDDLVSAARTVKAAAQDAAPRPSVWARYVVFYGLVLIGSMVAGYFLQRNGWLSASATDGWKTVITLLTIISGFMITTMLFTGKVEAAKSLHSRQLIKFVKKSNHLLFSQWLTLINHICSLIVVGALIAFHTSAPQISY